MNVIKYPYRIIKKLFHKQILFNVNNKLHDKRALLVYLALPFTIDKNDKTFKTHTNYWRNIEIAKILDTFGYTVDVINHSEIKYNPKKKYDLIIGLGKAFEKLVKESSSEVKKVYISTGSEANFFNQTLNNRINKINNQTSCKLNNIRVNQDDSYILKDVDSIICLGNNITAETYRPYFNKKIYCFNNHGYDESSFFSNNKKFEESRKNFLFISGSGKVLNGLDLLLTVFKKRDDLHLYIGGSFNGEDDFVSCYKKELYDTPNIHTEGWLSIGTSKFNELVNKCGMIIVPICAGASHGSVVNCMNYGLIPIITKETGIDVEDFGITLPSYEVEDIEKKVDWISNQPAEWHKKMSQRTFQAAKKKFSQSAFTKRFHQICTNIEL